MCVSHASFLLLAGFEVRVLNWYAMGVYRDSRSRLDSVGRYLYGLDCGLYSSWCQPQLSPRTALIPQSTAWILTNLVGPRYEQVRGEGRRFRGP